MRTRIVVTLLAMTVAFSGCFQRIAINSLGGIMDTGFTVVNEEQDLGIAGISIASNLTLLETLIKKDPDNTHYLLLASMGYSSYSLGFVEDDSTERARLLYLRGRDFGLQILDRNQKFRSARSVNVTELHDALSSFSKDNIPAIFWTAIGWGSYISLSLDDPSALVDLPKVEAMMQYVAKKDPTYFYGGAHFFLGTLYGSQPIPLGGNPDSSRAHFEECLKINGGKFLMTYVYYARSYAVQTQDRSLFDSCLAIVDTTSLDILPEARLSNAIAKKKAQLLRAREDELF
jgi:hypothetical protein